MNLKMVVALSLILLGTHSSGAETDKAITQLNIKCPAKKLERVIDNFYHECHSGMIRNEYNSCEKFVIVFKELMPEYDCARDIDMSGAKKFIVPAMWLLGDGQFADYHSLIHELVFEKKYSIVEYTKARKEARTLFYSQEFKKVLDAAGEVYEAEWEAHEKKKKE